MVLLAVSGSITRYLENDLQVLYTQPLFLEKGQLTVCVKTW